MTTGNLTFSRFREYASIVLGSLMGALIAMPVAAEANAALMLVPLGAVLGGLVGYRRRASTFFLYFCIVCILILSSVIMFESAPAPGGGAAEIQAD